MNSTININVETLVKVLIANNQGCLITHAVILDTNNADRIVPQLSHILVEVASSCLGSDNSFIDNHGNKKNYGYIACEVLKIDQYKVSDQFLVLLPDGTTKWTNYKDSVKETTTWLTRVDDLLSE